MLKSLTKTHQEDNPGHTKTQRAQQLLREAETRDKQSKVQPFIRSTDEQQSSKQIPDQTIVLSPLLMGSVLC